MIIATGYSKDPSIIPEGIAITWSKGMIEEGFGTLKVFVEHFMREIEAEDGLWYQKCKNKPKHNILYVYVIFKNRLRYRCQFVMYERGETTVYDAYGPKQVCWGRIGMTGPVVRCSYKRVLKGFQGFRYTTKLF